MACALISYTVACAGIEVPAPVDPVSAESGTTGSTPTGNPNVGQVQYDGTVNAYPAPAGVNASPDYSVTANGKSVFCYTADNLDPNGTALASNPNLKTSIITFCPFDMDANALVTVTLLAGLTQAHIDTSSVIVRPVAAQLLPSVSGNQFSIRIATPGVYSVEPGGAVTHTLHIVANPLEVNAPSATDPNVVYIGAGVQNTNNCTVPLGKTLYLAAGAVLNCNTLIIPSKSSIEGRGIVITPSANRSAIQTAMAEGVTFIGQVDNFFATSPSVFENVKIFSTLGGMGYYAEIGPTLSVNNSFIRTASASGVYFLDGAASSVSGSVTNTQIWTSTPELGFEGALSMQLVTHSLAASNVTILHAAVGISVGEAASATAHSTFSNVVMESVEDVATLGEVSANVTNVTMQDVNVLSCVGCTIKFESSPGITPAPAYSNVTFDTVTIAGKKLTAGDTRLSATGVTNLVVH